MHCSVYSRQGVGKHKGLTGPAVAAAEGAVDHQLSFFLTSAAHDSRNHLRASRGAADGELCSKHTLLRLPPLSCVCCYCKSGCFDTAVGSDLCHRHCSGAFRCHDSPKKALSKKLLSCASSLVELLCVSALMRKMWRQRGRGVIYPF